MHPRKAGDRFRVRSDPAPSRDRNGQGPVQSRPIDRRDGRGRRRTLSDAFPESAKGAFDLGGFPEFLPGQLRVDDEISRKRFEEAWERDIRAKPGLAYQGIFDGIMEGKIKALYVFGEDPFISPSESGTS